MHVADSLERWYTVVIKEHNFSFIFPLTVSGPHNIRLVILHSGINDDGAAQTQCFSFTAKGHFEFVEDGCSKGDTVFWGETICRGNTAVKILYLHLLTFFYTSSSYNHHLEMFFVPLMSERPIFTLLLALYLVSINSWIKISCYWDRC